MAASTPVKPNRIADVTVFGAKGNGSADDTAAINRAINSGRKVLYFPPGTYMTDGNHALPAGVTVRGDGWANSIVKLNANANSADRVAIFKNENGGYSSVIGAASGYDSGYIFRDICFDPNVDNQVHVGDGGAPTNGHVFALMFNGARDILIDNCFFYDGLDWSTGGDPTRGGAIALHHGILDCTIQNNRFAAVAGQAYNTITCYWGIQGIRILHNTVNVTAQSPTYHGQGARWDFAQFAPLMPADDPEEATRDITCIGNRIEATSLAIVDHDPLTGNSADVIEGFRFHGHTAQVDDTQQFGALVSGNVFQNLTHGCKIMEGMANLTFTGNTFYNCARWGIWQEPSTVTTSPASRGIAIVGNHFQRMGQGAVQLKHAEGCVVTDNVIDRHGTDQLGDGGSYSAIYLGGVINSRVSGNIVTNPGAQASAGIVELQLGTSPSANVNDIDLSDQKSCEGLATVIKANQGSITSIKTPIGIETVADCVGGAGDGMEWANIGDWSSGPVTILFTVHPASVSGATSKYVLMTHDGSNNIVGGIFIVDTGTDGIISLYHTTSGTAMQVITSGQQLYTDRPYHVAITWDGVVDGSGVEIYRDGQSRAVTIDSAGTGTASSQDGVWWLANRDDGARPLDGWLSRVAVVGEVLTAAEIRRHMSGVPIHNISGSVIFDPDFSNSGIDRVTRIVPSVTDCSFKPLQQ